MLIFQYIIGLKIQIVDFKNDFDQADIPSEEPLLSELPRYFNNDGGKCDVVLRLNKVLCGQAIATCLRYDKLRNGLSDRGFVASKFDPCLFISNNEPDIYFSVHQCDRFTHNTKASHQIAENIICRYIQGTKDKGRVFNPST